MRTFNGVSTPQEGLPRATRVLLLLTSLHGGGAERVATHLARLADTGEFDIRIGVLRAAGPFVGDVEPARLMVARNGERRFVFDGANAGFYRPTKLLAGTFLAPFAYRRMIRDFRPDVLMSFLKGTSLIADRAIALAGRPRPRWIVREGNNTLAVIDDELRSPTLRRVIGGYVARRYRAADTVLTNSRHMADGLIQDLALDPTRMRVIHNPIDTTAILAASRAPIDRASTRPFIVAVGRLEHQKGHDLLLRAFAASASRDTHDLAILGRGSRLATLHTLADELGIAGQVQFEGFASNPWAWVAKADLFVLPSRWEGFPTALGEALACRTPTVATDCRFGPRELVEHGKSGWLVAPDNAEALRAGIDRVLGDPAFAARLREDGARRVEAFALSAMLDRYAALFRESLCTP